MSKEYEKEIIDLIKKDNGYQGVQFNHACLNDDGKFTNRLKHNG